jgi:hypothetical protein
MEAMCSSEASGYLRIKRSYNLEDRRPTLQYIPGAWKEERDSQTSASNEGDAYLQNVYTIKGRQELPQESIDIICSFN